MAKWKTPLHKSGVTVDPATLVLEQGQMVEDTQRGVFRIGNGAKGGRPVGGSVSSRDHMKSFQSGEIRLREAGREGNFVWDPTVLIATHQADPGEGVYVAPDPAANGAWRRVVSESTYYKPEWFGAIGDGVAVDHIAIQRMFDSGAKRFRFTQVYLMYGPVTVLRNDLEVVFGSARFINGGVGFLFNFGSTSDTPIYSGLETRGGIFEQLNPATIENQNYIRVAGMRDFLIEKPLLKNVSNGGLYVEGGCEDGVLDRVTIRGKSGYSICRGIWLIGSTVSDWALQLVDTATISRNATPFPQYAVKNVRIVKPNVKMDAYGIYLMNTRDITIDQPNVDISGAGANRCIAVNNYSDNVEINGGTLRSDRSSTGVLVTQVGSCRLNGVKFRGSFGGNRAVYSQYLASVFAYGCDFAADGTQSVQVDMGGFALLKANTFSRSAYTAGARAVYFTGIDPAATGGAIGTGGTVLAGSGVIFTDNVLRRIGNGVVATCNLAASNANQPSPEFVHMWENTFFDMDQATGQERIAVVTTTTTGNVIRLRFDKNVVLPFNYSDRNRPTLVNANYVIEHDHAWFAGFTVDAPAAAGAIVVTKLGGANFSLTAVRSGMNIVLTPRTQMGVSGATVPPIIGVTNAGASTDPVQVGRLSGRVNANNYEISAFDTAGAQIDAATTKIKFNLILGPVNAGT